MIFYKYFVQIFHIGISDSNIYSNKQITHETVSAVLMGCHAVSFQRNYHEKDFSFIY